MVSISELAQKHLETVATGQLIRSKKRRNWRAKWPMVSYQMGCHPSQINEVKQVLHEHGTDAEIRPNGTTIITSQRHHKKVAEALGMVDYSGGYNSAGATKTHKEARAAAIEARRVRFKSYQKLMGRYERARS